MYTNKSFPPVPLYGAEEFVVFELSEDMLPATYYENPLSQSEVPWYMKYMAYEHYWEWLKRLRNRMSNYFESCELALLSLPLPSYYGAAIILEDMHRGKTIREHWRDETCKRGWLGDWRIAVEDVNDAIRLGEVRHAHGLIKEADGYDWLDRQSVDLPPEWRNQLPKTDASKTIPISLTEVYHNYLDALPKHEGASGRTEESWDALDQQNLTACRDFLIAEIEAYAETNMKVGFNARPLHEFSALLHDCAPLGKIREAWPRAYAEVVSGSTEVYRVACEQQSTPANTDGAAPVVKKKPQAFLGLSCKALSIRITGDALTVKVEGGNGRPNTYKLKELKLRPDSRIYKYLAEIANSSTVTSTVVRLQEKNTLQSQVSSFNKTFRGLTGVTDNLLSINKNQITVRCATITLITDIKV